MRYYICIDLKSFYASVECVYRHLNPLDTNLVVADKTRTEKTICLAVTPSLKAYGIGGRARLYEVVSKVGEINLKRRKSIKSNFIGKSYLDSELKNNPKLELDYIVAPPRMNLYMEMSTKIYNIYLKYFASEDIYVYSIDEVFIDITNYLTLYKLNPYELSKKIILDVYNITGITATGGIGTNLYLAKIAMDIEAKHKMADGNGVRIAFLNEKLYREKLWNHKPLTDFWQVGKGISKRLNDIGLYTMGDLALFSLSNENRLFKIFGVNAEILIDHAWGYEPCTLKDIKSYKPKTKSISSGQVLHEPYDYHKTKLILKEMTDLLTLELVSKNYLTSKIVLHISYDVSNLLNNYNGIITKDFYGRSVPKPAHGTINIDHYTSSTIIITSKVLELFDKIINASLLVRKVNISFDDLILNENNKEQIVNKQLSLFESDKDIQKQKDLLKDEKEELKVQKAILNIKNKYGKNSILKGINLEEGATTIQRNKQVGGHNG